MNWIKNLRTATGLSQTNLCYWLQIPKSTLAMAETGQRDLPTPAHLKLTGLYVAMLKPEVKTAAEQETPAPPKAWQLAALHKKITAEAIDLRLKAFTLQKRINKWNGRQAQREQMRLLIGALGHLQQASNASENDTRWLQRRKEELQDEETRENIFELQQMQLKLAMMETEAAKLEEMAKALTVGSPMLLS